MNHPSAPPKRVKALIGVASIVGTMLTGLALGVLVDADSIPLISRSEASIPETAPPPDDRQARQASGAESRRNLLATCQGRKNIDPVPDVCRQNSDQGKQKLLVMLALWRVLP